MTSRITDAGGVAELADQARALLSAAAVRERAHRLLALARAGEVEEWEVDLARLPAAADLVADVTRAAYPDLNVPFHARWRHFVVDGRDLWRARAEATEWSDAAAQARAEVDLAIVSVLLDAGAGPDWRYTDEATGRTIGRSEGLALASLRAFEAGLFSDEPDDPLRVDAAALEGMRTPKLARAFQVSDDNPLAGLEGRAALLRRLGRAVEGQPDLFARVDTPRPGGLYDALAARAASGGLPAPAILESLLAAFGPIWEGRPAMAAVDLGDCWPHPALSGPHPADGYAPLHKLSQWLAYSLIEPLEAAGVAVTDKDGLTGLAEYRNGGLFVDAGVLVPSDPDALARTYAVSHPFVVGWRALTVALLDEIAPLVRERLGVAAAEFPLACVLEGGTWAAGRKLAREQRADGGPPFDIISDGTVF